MILLDGKRLAKEIKQELAQAVENWVAGGGKKPHLAAVLVGQNPASQAYVRSKVRSCAEVGFESTLLQLDEEITEEALLDTLAELNADDSIDGYIVQLPLPPHIDEQRITLAIRPSKDVDGFTPENFGRMALGLRAYLPATPYGILQMLERYEIPTYAKHCVVVGRSNIVGLPMSILMGKKSPQGNCTVTLTHSATADLAAITREADILIAAIGIPGFISADMVKSGAVVIDVGINRVEDPAQNSGYRLVGDVDFDAVAPQSAYITPVPGGVGLMTVTALLQNTFLAARKEIYT